VSKRLGVGDTFQVSGALSKYRLVSEPERYSVYDDWYSERDRVKFQAVLVVDGWGRPVTSEQAAEWIDMTAIRFGNYERTFGKETA
jgi:hypothetical protein